MTYRERVDNFWKWWVKNADRIYEAVEKDGGVSFQRQIAAVAAVISPDIGWGFGPGANGKGHSFTMTPGGIPTKRFLIDFWHSKAPCIEGWTFYSSRQPSINPGSFNIVMGGTRVTAESLWISPKVDLENEAIDITAWSPTFAKIDREGANTFLFLLLDDALGEDTVSRCIGKVEIGDGKLAQSLPVTELSEFVDATFEKQGWSKKRHRGYTYDQPELEADFPRSDIYVGNTMDVNIIQNYNQNSGPFDHPVTKSGVEIAFIQLPAAILQDQTATELRAEIEDAVNDELEVLEAGVVFGSAVGSSACYIDLVLFDPDRARQAIKNVMNGKGYEGQYQIFPFTKTS